MIVYGGIPDKITYVVRRPRAVTRGWHGLDDLWLADPVTATPAFPVDPASKTSMETAEHWVRGWKDGVAVTKVERDNAPIASVQVLTIEVRDEGGRAYKVRLDGVGDGKGENTLYVDMREDVVLDAMLVNGVKKGGTLPGPFVWGRLHSQLRLVRVGSTLHAAIVAAGARMAEKVVRAKDHEVGGVYLNRRLEARVYLGRCDTDYLEHEQVQGRYRRYTGPNLVRQTERGANPWFELKYHGDGLRDVVKGDAAKLATADHWLKVWEKGLVPEHTWIWGLREIKKPAVTQQVARVAIDWDRLRRAAVAHAAHAAATDPYRGETRHDRTVTVRDSHLMHASRLAHVRPTGEPCPAHDEYKGLWARAKGTTRPPPPESTRR